MAIKPVEERPMNLTQKRESYRQQIRNDINEAIQKQIPRFEFEGDYNWKYLAQYAREEADEIWRNEWWSRMRAAKKAFNLADGMRTPSYKDKGKYIKISNVRMPDRNHVYCEIDFDAPERICKPLIEEAIEEQKERDQKLVAKDLTAKIKDLGFTLRTRNCLLRAGFETMADLQNQSRESIMRIRNMGAKSTQEVIDMMHRFGIKLIDEEETAVNE